MTASMPAGFSIAAVERETGLSKDTLRVWERRYGFPQPARDAFDERVYPPDQVEKLRIIKGLMDQGHRPGKIVDADIDTLRGMAGRREDTVAEAVHSDAARPDLLHYIELCKAHRVEALRRELSQSLLRLGMYRFVTELIAPLTTMVGNHWAKGNLAVFEEHLYTESVLGVMRGALAGVPAGTLASGVAARPRILLTTIPHEPHALGLLMSEAVFTLEGAHCISLGVQTPITEIMQAAEAQAADVVALSFSASVRSAHVLEALADLRTGLPPTVEIWVGGRSSVLRRRPPASVRVLELTDIRDALIDWRLRFPL